MIFLNHYLFFHFYKSAFNDFFFAPSCQTRMVSYGLPHIHDCYFTRFSLLTDIGGIIYYSGVDAFLVLEKCIFHNLISSSEAAGLYFQISTNGGLAISKVCVSNCSADSNMGQFSSSITLSFCLTTYHFSSIEKTAMSSINSRRGSIYMKFGFQNITSTNSSNNNCFSYSGCFCQNHTSLSITYTTFWKNTLRQMIHSSGVALINNCNIIQNTAQTSTPLIESELNSLTIRQTIFSGNTGTLFICIS